MLLSDPFGRPVRLYLHVYFARTRDRRRSRGIYESRAVVREGFPVTEVRAEDEAAPHPRQHRIR